MSNRVCGGRSRQFSVEPEPKADKLGGKSGTSRQGRQHKHAGASQARGKAGDPKQCRAFPLGCPMRWSPDGGRLLASPTTERSWSACPSDLLASCLQQLNLPGCLHLLRHHGADPFRQPRHYSDEAARSLFRNLPGIFHDPAESGYPDVNGHTFRHQALPSTIQVASRLSGLLRSPACGGAANRSQGVYFFGRASRDNSFFPPSSSGPGEASLFRCLYTWGAASSHQLGYLLFSSGAEKRTHPPRPVHFAASDDAAALLASPNHPPSASTLLSTAGCPSPQSGYTLSPSSSSVLLPAAASCRFPASGSPVCTSCRARARNEASTLRVQMVRCGPSISLASTVDGEVWVWGKGADGGNRILSEPTLLRGLDDPRDAVRVAPQRGFLPAQYGAGDPQDAPLASSRVPPRGGGELLTCDRCGCILLDNASRKRFRGRIVRGAAVGASHCLLLVDVPVVERPGPSPEEALVSCGRSRRLAPKGEASACGDASTDSEACTSAAGVKDAPRRRTHRRSFRRKPNLGAAQKVRAEGEILSPELLPVSFAALRGSDKDSALSSEDGDAEEVSVLSTRHKETTVLEGPWIYRTERRLYVWGSNARSQLGFSCSQHKSARSPADGASGVSAAAGEDGGLPTSASSPASEESDCSSCRSRSPVGRKRSLPARAGCDAASEQAPGDRPRGKRVLQARPPVENSAERARQGAASTDAEKYSTFRPILLCRWKSPPSSEPVPPAAFASEASAGGLAAQSLSSGAGGDMGDARDAEERGSLGRRQTLAASPTVAFSKRAASLAGPGPLFYTPRRVEFVAAGFTHSLLLLDNGCVCVFGDNTFGQCAQPPSVERVSLPLLLSQLPPVVAIAAGQNTNAVVSSSPQKVFVWGGSPAPGSALLSNPPPAGQPCAASTASTSFSGSSASASSSAGGERSGPGPLLSFFAPIRLKGAPRRDAPGDAFGEGWATQTTSQGCPLFTPDTLAINDAVGLAVGVDERLYVFHCGVRPPVVSPAVPLCASAADAPSSGLSPQLQASSSSAHDGGRSRTPASPCPRKALPLEPLCLSGPWAAGAPPGGVRQLCLSSSRIFLLTADGLLYSAPIPSNLSSRAKCDGVGHEDDRARRDDLTPLLLPRNRKLSNAESTATPLFIYASFSPAASMPPESPPSQCLRLPPAARPASGPGDKSQRGAWRGPSGACPVSPAWCPLYGDRPASRAASAPGGDDPPGGHPGAARGFDGWDLLPQSARHAEANAAVGVPLWFSPVRHLTSIAAFSCSETHSAAIVEIHSPQFRPHTKPSTAPHSGLPARQTLASVSSAFATACESLPLGCPATLRPSPPVCPSLSFCAAKALLRPRPPFPPPVELVVEVIIPLAVATGAKSLFDFCCLFLVYNLPLVLLACHAPASSPSASAAHALRGADLRTVFETLGSIRQQRRCFASQASTSATSPADTPTGPGEAYLLAAAGMQYVLRCFKSAVATAYLGQASEALNPPRSPQRLDDDAPDDEWLHVEHDDAPPRTQRHLAASQLEAVSYASSGGHGLSRLWWQSGGGAADGGGAEFDIRGQARRAPPSSSSRVRESWLSLREPHEGSAARVASPHGGLVSGPHAGDAVRPPVDSARSMSDLERRGSQPPQADAGLRVVSGDDEWLLDTTGIPSWVLAYAQCTRPARHAVAAANRETTGRQSETRKCSAAGEVSAAAEDQRSEQRPERCDQEEEVSCRGPGEPNPEGTSAGAGDAQSTVDERPCKPASRPSKESDAGGVEAASTGTAGASSSANCGSFQRPSVAPGLRLISSSSCLSDASSAQLRRHADDAWRAEGREALALWIELLGARCDASECLAGQLCAAARALAAVLQAPLPFLRDESRSAATPQTSELRASHPGEPAAEAVRPGAAESLSSWGGLSPLASGGPEDESLPPILLRLPRRPSDLLGPEGGAIQERSYLIDRWSGAFWTDPPGEQEDARGQGEAWQDDSAAQGAAAPTTQAKPEQASSRVADGARRDAQGGGSQRQDPHESPQGADESLDRQGGHQGDGRSVGHVDASETCPPSHRQKELGTHALAQSASPSSVHPLDHRHATEDAGTKACEANEASPATQETWSRPLVSAARDMSTEKLETGQKARGMSPGKLSRQTSGRRNQESVDRPNSGVQRSPAFSSQSSRHVLPRPSSSPSASFASPPHATEDFPSLSSAVCIRRPPASPAVSAAVAPRGFPLPPRAADDRLGASLDARQAPGEGGVRSTRDAPEAPARRETPAAQHRGDADGSEGLDADAVAMDEELWQHVEARRGNRQARRGSFGQTNIDRCADAANRRHVVPGLPSPAVTHAESPQQPSFVSSSSRASQGRGGWSEARMSEAHQSRLRLPRPARPPPSLTAECRQPQAADSASVVRRGRGETERNASGGGEPLTVPRGIALEDFLVASSSGQKRKKNSRGGERLDKLSRDVFDSKKSAQPAWQNREAESAQQPDQAANGSLGVKRVADLAEIMREEEALRQERERKLQLRHSQERAQHPSSVVRTAGPPSVVIVARPQTGAGQAAAGAATVSAGARLREAPTGLVASRLPRADAASFNRWGREAALRAQGEEGFGAPDLAVIQWEQFAEKEEDLARRREEAELQEALRLVREMEERERREVEKFQREVRPAAAMEKRRQQEEGQLELGSNASSGWPNASNPPRAEERVQPPRGSGGRGATASQPGGHARRGRRSVHRNSVGPPQRREPAR
ncbi:hypothetical protein BESB_016450 [Besnoitia besnoiti]|uniref:Chromosome condensation regulator repeat protein n=1 Tax=Besnoitia besnoiti TaxID=94643 RepID=A0A2A9M9P2_BESBE|nr:hypothetical protein BESB_016450 [Besnoitia besnoiti]PFH32327.1 hypothetical protein BESB_016450 [Besnoitia besnoiti]